MEKHCKDCDWSPKVENVEALEKRLDELIDGMASVGRLAVEEQGIAHAVECQCRLCRIIRIVRAHVPITLQEQIDKEVSLEGKCGTCKHWGSDGPGPVDEFTDDELDDNLKWCPATCGFTSAGADCEGVDSNYEKRTEKQDKSNGS